MTDKVNDKLAQCLEGSIYADRKVVFGQGKTGAPILALVGEAPGAKEEEQGRPFVGSAGKNLESFLQVLEISREEIYITNVVKIRPYKLSEKTGRPVNRPPDSKEIQFFCPFLKEELAFVAPKIIVTLGNVPLKALMSPELTIGDCHGKILNYRDCRLFPLYHPAAVIYNRALNDVYIQDLMKLKEVTLANS